MVLEEDDRAHRSFLPASQSTSFSAAEPSSSILIWSPFAGGGASARTRRPRAARAGPLRLDADVCQRQRLGRLRLRSHDPLQRRVARLVDRVGDRHDGRQRSDDHVVAEFRLALPGRRTCRRSRGARPGIPAGAAADRPRRPRGRRRRSRMTAGRRARDRRPRARASSRSRSSSPRGRSPLPRRRTRGWRGRPPSRGPYEASRAPWQGRAKRRRPPRRVPP